MFCTKCGHELDDNGNCPNCHTDNSKSNNSVMSVICLITGIISMVICCSQTIAFIFSLVSIVSGILAFIIDRPKEKGTIITGIICSCITILIYLTGNDFGSFLDSLTHIY